MQFAKVGAIADVNWYVSGGLGFQDEMIVDPEEVEACNLMVQVGCEILLVALLQAGVW